MRIEINTDVLGKYNLTLSEYLYLLLNIQGTSIVEIQESVIGKGFAETDLFSTYQVVMSNENKELVSRILVESATSVENAEKHSHTMEEIAVAINSIYDKYKLKGCKPGTTYPWKSSKSEIATKLQVLIAKYHASFTLEEIKDATELFIQRYIAKYGTDYKYLPLSKYFVLKGKGEDMKSDLLSTLENMDQEEITETNSDDFFGGLV